MKRALLLVMAFAAMSFAAVARDGYRIKLKYTDRTDSMVYLAHYFGKPLPTLYKSDSAKLDKNGVAVFNNTEKTLGGIYIMMLQDKATFFEFILTNGDDVEITATASQLPTGVSFKNSTENEYFKEYISFLKGFGDGQQRLTGLLAAAKTKKDSTGVREQIATEYKGLTKFRRDFVAKHPSSFTATVFNALEQPEVPEGKHLLPNGKVDSAFGFHYYRDHYWDKFDFKDERLIHTPLYDGKLEEYFNQLVVPGYFGSMPVSMAADSVKAQCDSLLAWTRGKKDIFRYTLWFLGRQTETPKIMGLDEVFVHLVLNYYMKGDAYWLHDTDISKYYDAAMKIASNIIGKPAPALDMQDSTGKPFHLADVKSKYTLLVFWDPTCGHCRTEVPQVDSAYKAVLKSKGVKIVGVRTEGGMDKWQEFIKEKKLNEWMHVYDPAHKSNYRSTYNVYTTPVVYLLDENKNILGKRLDHSNIGSVIEMIEKQRESGKANGGKGVGMK